MDEIERPDGISRRRMLKRIGVGTAIAWSAPVLTSLRMPAFAQATSALGCTGCTGTCSAVACQTDCFCDTTTEGRCGCHPRFGCDVACQTSIDCPAGSQCYADTCCGTPICIPDCGASVGSVSGPSTNR